MIHATAPHLLNILVHIGAGLAAMIVGFLLLWRSKGDRRHRRGGRLFLALGAVVCASAALGLALFRFMPMFAVMTVLVAYQLLGGWRTARTRGAGPDALDALLWAGAAATSAWLVAHLVRIGALPGPNAAVLVPTLAAIGVLLAYDAARWLFPRRWHGALWRYEHVYKLVASLFGMLSAAVGNTVRVGQPWSQLLPSALGVAVIAWCWRRTWQAQRAGHGSEAAVSEPKTAAP